MNPKVKEKIDEIRGGKSELSLSGVRVTSEDARELIAAIKAQPNFHNFTLSTNQDVGALKILLEGLKDCPKLKTLSLGQIGQNHTELGSLVADIITSKAPLANVWISTANLGEDGATHIANAVAQKPIEWLIMRTCHIDDAGAKSIGEMLQKTTTLRSMNISDNAIANVGGCALAQGAQANTSLYELNAHNNKMNDEPALAFAEALAIHPNLCNFTIGNNPFSADAKEAIEQAILTHNNPNFYGMSDGLTGIWEFCNANEAAFTEQLKSWKDLDTHPLKFAQIEHGLSVMPGISSRFRGNQAIAHFEQWLGEMPTLNLSKLRSWKDITKPNKNGYCVLDNPRNWDHIEAIAKKLEEKGTPITLEQLQQRGRDGTPFLHYGLMHDAIAFAAALEISGIDPCEVIKTPMEDVIDHLTATRKLGNVFIEQLWTDATTHDLRQTVNCLTPEQKAQIPNLHTLYASLPSPSTRIR